MVPLWRSVRRDFADAPAARGAAARSVAPTAPAPHHSTLLPVRVGAGEGTALLDAMARTVARPGKGDGRPADEVAAPM